MTDYHDYEWGVPLHDDRKLFEFLVLDAAQAGLSWKTILYKRENYRQAFDEFDAARIARYDDANLERLLANPGIVRNRLKISSAIQNARGFLEIRKEFGSFDAYIWRFVNGRTIQILGAYRNPESALRAADRHPGWSNRVVMGDCPCYWLVSPADAQRLERAGELHP